MEILKMNERTRNNQTDMTARELSALAVRLIGICSFRIFLGIAPFLYGVYLSSLYTPPSKLQFFYANLADIMFMELVLYVGCHIH